MQSNKRKIQTGITALYCRLSRDDGTDNDSNSITSMSPKAHKNEQANRLLIHKGKKKSSVHNSNPL